MQIGYKLATEAFGPNEIIRQAVRAEEATTTMRTDDVMAQFACGPAPERHVEVVQQFVDADFDRIVLMNAGPDPDGFIDFFHDELSDRLRQLTPATAA